MSFATRIDKETAKRFLAAFDRQLKQIKIEYKAKRDSRRLGNPVLYLMREGWYERARKKQVEGGMRAFQAKTQLLAPSKEATVRILPELEAADDLYEHYRTFYVPNNAVLALAGDFETRSMLVRIKELFEPIPAGLEPTRIARPELSQNGEVRLSVEGPGATTYVQVCYRFPAALPS